MIECYPEENQVVASRPMVIYLGRCNTTTTPPPPKKVFRLVGMIMAPRCGGQCGASGPAPRHANKKPSHAIMRDDM
ncbi:hypothetical protein L211DRAFT_702113 [Terfezia boudieri ATCC MYA-4762]|uniref:Uncharacterized protein n=1 Tax=Terfezia boudieri ATCC MYA-4762 TaxID=1051890 RepID=A0A3N4LTG5_9PEZI|nr:hypothetical protein L211DRAFT_702113 [Terfezia boudieri ATCC MYA-4762]